MIEWPKEVLNQPGLVGDVVSWIRESSGMEQPKFALAAGLMLCGALLGRGVRDYTGQRTNLYCLAVGCTSAGKNAPIQAIQAWNDVESARKKNSARGERPLRGATPLLEGPFWWIVRWIVPHCFKVFFCVFSEIAKSRFHPIKSRVFNGGR